MNNSFSLSENDLKNFYNLKTLDPKNSWINDSIDNTFIDLLKWDDNAANEVEDNENINDEEEQQQLQDNKNHYENLLIDNPYEILRILNNNQDDINNNKNKNIDLNTIVDPLNNEKMSNLINTNDFDNNNKELQKYLINNRNFNVNLFLTKFHNKDSFEQLSKSLDNLDLNLQNQSKELKFLVQSNFNKYVRIKNRLDSIYTENNNLTNFDNLNLKINDSLTNFNMIIKPLLDNEKNLNNLQKTKKFIKKHEFFFNSPKVLLNYLNSNDYDNLILHYSKAKLYYYNLKKEYSNNFNSKNIIENNSKQKQTNRLLFLSSNSTTPKIISKIWSEIKNVMNLYKKQIWYLLLNGDDSNENNNNNQNININESTFFLPLLSRLIDIQSSNDDEDDKNDEITNTNDVNNNNDIIKDNKNPIIDWIDLKLKKLNDNLNKISNKMFDKIINSQNLILNDSNNNSINLKFYYLIESLFNIENFNSNVTTYSSSSILTDNSNIIEMWLLILNFINQLNDLIQSFIHLYINFENFINGSYQSLIINEKKKMNILIGENNILFNNNNDDENDNNNFDKSISNISLNKDEVSKIKKDCEYFLKNVTEVLLKFFGSSQSTLQDIINPNNKINITKENTTPQDFGFIPPFANGLSCLRYLPKIINPLLKSTTEMAQLNISSNSITYLTKIINLVIIRSVHSLITIKLRDLSELYILEDWSVYQNIKLNGNSNLEYGITQFPSIALIFQKLTISTIRDILYSFERLPKLNNISITGPPTENLLKTLETKQIDSMSNILQSVLQNAAKEKDNPRSSHTILTLTNLQYIRESTFTNIISYYNDAFESSNLSSSTQNLFNLLRKMEDSIFTNYLSDLKVHIKNILVTRFNEIDWPKYTSNSFRISDYLVEVLMLLVTVHSECFRIGPQLILKVLKETQLFISKFLYEAFKKFVGKLSPDALLQITVDLQFLTRILGKDILEKDTEVTLTACLQNCFQNDVQKMNTCITETQLIVDANLKRTNLQFSSFTSSSKA